MKVMFRRESLKALADCYLKFLITRDEAHLRSRLSLDFPRRLNVSRQLKFIKTLPSLLDYGLSPETQLWSDYAMKHDGDLLRVSPFQFHVCYRSVTNPLQTETMTVTIHAAILEGDDWKLESVLCQADYDMLVNYTNTATPSPSPSPRGAGFVSSLLPKNR